jgi:hypothetical protein
LQRLRVVAPSFLVPRSNIALSARCDEYHKPL